MVVRSFSGPTYLELNTSSPGKGRRETHQRLAEVEPEKHRAYPMRLPTHEGFTGARKIPSDSLRAAREKEFQIRCRSLVSRDECLSACSGRRGEL